jgi:hypothetical protein
MATIACKEVEEIDETYPSLQSSQEPPQPNPAAQQISLLPANEKFVVRVSHVESGASTFYVQPHFNYGHLHNMGLNLKKELLEEPKWLAEGKLYVVKQGTLFYRCVLLSASDPYTARLIDVGKVVTTDLGSLFDLPSKYKRFGQMAYRFSLAGVCKSDQLRENPDIDDQFHKMIESKNNFQLQVVENCGPTSSQYCELYQDGVNIEEVFRKSIFYETQSLLNKFSYEVVVSSVETKSQTLPWTFFVQMAAEKSRLEALKLDLLQICHSAAAASLNQLIENAPVLAMCDVDHQWYRGQLLQKRAKGCTVFFVDYGYTAEVPLKNLRMPSRDLVQQMPKQAIKCTLDGLSSNLAARDIMANFTKEKVCLPFIIYIWKLKT